MQLKELAKTFDEIRQEDEVEFWYARELSSLLGYKSWRRFNDVVQRAIESCKKSGVKPENHFASAVKMVTVGSGTTRKIEDYKLTRYACYLIAQNGDSRIPEIAFAQMYFAMQTRKQEILEQNIEEIERLVSRKKLGETEKEFAKTIYERGVQGQEIGEIKSAGDSILFGGFNTKQMKQKLGIKNPKKPLADVLPTVTLKAKDLATEMTTVNTKRKGLEGKRDIKSEHMSNNRGVRKALTDTGINPEELPAAEDIKRVESRHRKQAKQIESMDTNQLK